MSIYKPVLPWPVLMVASRNKGRAVHELAWHAYAISGRLVASSTHSVMSGRGVLGQRRENEHWTGVLIVELFKLSLVR